MQGYWTQKGFSCYIDDMLFSSASSRYGRYFTDVPQIEMPLHIQICSWFLALTVVNFIHLIFAAEGGPSYFDFTHNNRLYKVTESQHYGFQAEKVCSQFGMNASLAVIDSSVTQVRRSLH